MSHRTYALAAFCAVLLSNPMRAADPEQSVDICVYGATAAGIVAAITAKQEGKTVVLIEPSRWLGGILGAGIKPMRDCPEPRAVGGLTKTKVFGLGDNPPSRGIQLPATDFDIDRPFG